VTTKRRIATLAAALALVAGLSLLFAFPLRPFFRDSILGPILRTSYFVHWYLGRISQLLLWNVFVAAAGLLLLRSVLRGRARGLPRLPARRATRIENELNRLAETIRIAGHRPFFRAILQRDLSAVATQVVAHGERISESSALAWLKDVGAHERPGLAVLFAEGNVGRSISGNDNLTTQLEEALSFLEGFF